MQSLKSVFDQAVRPIFLLVVAQLLSLRLQGHHMVFRLDLSQCLMVFTTRVRVTVRDYAITGQTLIQFLPPRRLKVVDLHDNRSQKRPYEQATGVELLRHGFDLPVFGDTQGCGVITSLDGSRHRQVMCTAELCHAHVSDSVVELRISTSHKFPVCETWLCHQSAGFVCSFAVSPISYPSR